MSAFILECQITSKLSWTRIHLEHAGWCRQKGTLVPELSRAVGLHKTKEVGNHCSTVCLFVFCWQEGLLMCDNCVTSWPGCANAGREWPWLSVGKWSIMYCFIDNKSYNLFCVPFHVSISPRLSLIKYISFPLCPLQSPLTSLCCFTMFPFYFYSRRLFCSQCGAQTKLQEHLFLIAALLLLIMPSATFFVLSLSLTALHSVGKYGMWPPARAEEEKTNRPEVSQRCQSSYCHRPMRHYNFLYNTACKKIDHV